MKKIYISSRLAANGACSRSGIFFTGEGPSWKTIFHHYRKWCKKKEWQKIYSRILVEIKNRLDLSISPISTVPIRQYTEAAKRLNIQEGRSGATNALFLLRTIREFSRHVSNLRPESCGSLRNRKRVEEIVGQLSEASIAVDGLFCDLDAGFDGKELRSALISHGITPNVCPNRGMAVIPKEDWLYDEEMYQERWKIERTNAWMDGFKAVLNCFDNSPSPKLKGWNFLAFSQVGFP